MFKEDTEESLSRRKGDQERQKLQLAAIKQEAAEREAEKETQSLIQRYEEKQKKSELTRRLEIEKKEKMTLENFQKFTSTIERAATVKNQSEIKKLGVAEKDLRKFQKVLKNQRDL